MSHGRYIDKNANMEWMGEELRGRREGGRHGGDGRREGGEREGDMEGERGGGKIRKTSIQYTIINYICPKQTSCIWLSTSYWRTNFESVDPKQPCFFALTQLYTSNKSSSKVWCSFNNETVINMKLKLKQDEQLAMALLKHTVGQNSVTMHLCNDTEKVSQSSAKGQRPL